MRKETGGAAFPYVHDIPPPPGMDRSINVEEGMSLRDYFAAKALAGIATRIMFGGDSEVFNDAAIRAYAFADAMITERAK